jgi:hypothetical protein
VEGCGRNEKVFVQDCILRVGMVKEMPGGLGKGDYFISRLKAAAIHSVQYNAKLMQASPKPSMRLLLRLVII